MAGGGRFLSLKWKALLLTSLVLLVLSLVFSGSTRYMLRQQLAQQRDLARQQFRAQLRGLLRESGVRLQQTGTLVGSLLRPDWPKDGETEALRSQLERLWEALLLDMSLEGVALYDRSGTLLLARQVLPEPARADRRWRSPTMVAAVRRVIDGERPESFNSCAPRCLQIAVTPLLGPGSRVVGAVLLAVPLELAVTELKHVVATDVGLLTTDVGIQGNGLPAPGPGSWGGSVLALTNAGDMLGVLRDAAARYPNVLALREPVLLAHGGHHYEIWLEPLEETDPGRRVDLMVVSDVTAEVAGIRRGAARSLLLGLGGLALAEALLLLVLWRPMSQLRGAAAMLPLLAGHELDAVRKAAAGHGRRGAYRDEVDVLDAAAVALADQLEALNLEVADHTRALGARMQELTEEKAFISHLLDVVQVVILTLDQDSRIRMINAYGELLTGFSKGELVGQPIGILFPQCEASVAALHRLKGLIAGTAAQAQHECQIRTKEGMERTIAWYHSRLAGSAGAGAVVLSAGLDITPRKEAEERLSWLADHDPLTGLLNRRRFEAELEAAVVRAQRYGHTGALLFLDLDQFKYINDTSGHRAGDLLLWRLGEHLARVLRHADKIGRLGGDEFGVILQEADEATSALVAEKIHAYLGEAPFSYGGHIHKVTASIGIAPFPVEGESAQDLLANADLAMYRAKEGGGGRWHLARLDDQSRQVMRERVRWKERIERAIAEQRFVLYAQPMMALVGGVMGHYEILLRMCGDAGEIIPPARFIPVAESTGLIRAINLLVLRKSLAFLGELRRRGTRAIFSINITPHAFEEASLPQRVQELLTEYGTDPGQLILEITETAAVADFAATRESIINIRNLGCRFAVDDFGTGFSSFDYLRQLPVDFIKIDGSFIHHLVDRPDDQVLVRAMTQVAKGFDKQTVAEHVETVETLDLLRELGVDFAQGYLFGKPVPVAELFPIESQSESLGTAEGGMRAGA
jgi:diguanylate cyclase (GGDEF)-like protein/PAS domain S-box-containing protein